ncbi:PstS family phosphate ABC transporter substrate-binding protein [Halosegnis sp.]|uniref:PstS family phosphate ABC transporter substrate-binding protein n=1 Tax=Halosegnis sp. TaxID=2864959 RepID=UPI0035D40435
MADNESGGTSRRSFLTTAGALGAAGLAGCTAQNGGNSGGGNSGGSSNTLSGSISITGSSTVFPLATAMAEEFRKEHPEVEIDLKSTGSGGGFENFFCPGESDLNNASRPMKESEMEKCAENGIEAHEIKVATDALTVVINNENDWATELTVDQLAQIWGPEAEAGQTWADIDSSWPDEEIERFGAAETSGTFDYFTEVINGEEGAHTSDYEATENDRSIVQGVKGSKYAIGYFGFAYYFQNPDQVTAVAVDDGDGPVKPSLEAAASGEYTPLSRPLFTYPKKSALAEEHIAAFCRFFVESSTSEEIVAQRVGYVPNTEETAQTELEELNAAIEEASG